MVTPISIAGDQLKFKYPVEIRTKLVVVITFLIVSYHESLWLCLKVGKYLKKENREDLTRSSNSIKLF